MNYLNLVCKIVRDWFLGVIDYGILKRNTINYVYNHRTYSVLTYSKRGPRPFSRIEDENGEDVTNDVARYLGPSYNFHGIPTSPSMLGYESLEFVCHLGTRRAFAGDDIISLD